MIRPLGLLSWHIFISRFCRGKWSNSSANFHDLSVKFIKNPSSSGCVRLSDCLQGACLSILAECPSVRPCVRPSVRASVLRVHPSAHPSSGCVRLSICPQGCIRPSVRLSVLRVCPSVHLSSGVRPSVHLSLECVRPSVHPSVRPSSSASIHLTVFMERVCPSTRPSSRVCQSVWKSSGGVSVCPQGLIRYVN